MRQKKIMYTIFVLSFLPIQWLFACTSFSVSSDRVYYGLNFDHQDLPVRFSISDNGNIRTFYLSFEQQLNNKKVFVNTAGMNTAGLFSSCQQLHPLNIKPGQKTDANLYTFELFETISFCTSVTEVEEIARRLPLVDIPGITLHNLFADVKGRAMVTEAGTSATRIIEQDKNFMVMTNFALHSIAGKHYKQAKGFGDARYIICHEYLQQHAPNFSIDKGFTLLSMSRSKGASFSTLCSMVFDPQENEVYIAFKSDFSKIIKLSIKNGNIETFQGYGQKKQLPAAVTSEGLLVKNLEEQLH